MQTRYILINPIKSIYQTCFIPASKNVLENLFNFFSEWLMCKFNIGKPVLIHKAQMHIHIDICFRINILVIKKCCFLN